ncbi:MAG: Cache 3/Cache 2 fusion domain-containing protein [Candidatus Omnitrophota bacterium]
MKSYIRVVALLAVVGILFFAGAGCLYAQDVQAKLNTAMKMLQDKTAALGAASLDGGTLLFGDEEMNGNYDIVDEVADNNGCTATIFAAVGSDFKRIATNVIKDGNRAVGTLLDPNGAAIKKIRAGEAFYGEADILGEKYHTGYEPIKDSSGAIVGILYVGYKL